MNPETDYNLHLIKAQMGMAADPKGLKAGAAVPSNEKKWKAALDFQAMFLGQMYKSMRKTALGSDLTEASSGREIFTEMLDQEYARLDSRNPAAAGATGMEKALSGMSNSLAAQIYRAMLRQEGAEIPAAPGMKPMPFSATAAMAKALGGRKAQDLKSPSLSEAALEPMVELASKTYGVAKNLIKSVIGQESAGQPLAVSAAGAKGLMQLMDTTAADLGVKNAFNPRENVMGGTRYLKQMLEKFGGDEKLALAAYNAGPGAVDRFGGVPPYAETKNYVEKVLKAKADLDRKDAGEAGAR
jgi:soluble lytic murein transglycosylase-like protein